MKHRTLTRITKHKPLLIVCATVFLIASIVLGALFVLTLTPLTTLSLGSSSLSVTGLKSLATPMMAFSIALLLFFFIILIYLIIDKRKLLFTISEKSIDVHSRKASYTVELDNVDYLHLLRLPGTVEYGFREFVALYEHKNFSWTVIGPNLRDRENKKVPIGEIQQEIIEQFQTLKSQDLRAQLLEGQAIVFPYLAEHISMGVDTSQQEDFDRELIIEQDKGNLPVSQIMPTGAQISWQGRHLTIDGTEVDLYDITEVQLHRFSNSVVRKKGLLTWNYGQQVNLIDQDKSTLATIYLPSLLNGEIFLELLTEAVNGPYEEVE